MKSKLQYLVISLVFIFFTTLEIAGKEFTVKSYRLEDGLPNLRVNNILQDDYGILWFASDHEIFTYDGISWNVKYSSDKTGDPSYRKLIKDEKGNIWALPINWSDKIIYYNGTNWQSFPPIGELASKNVNQTSMDIKYSGNEFEVYVGTESAGVFLYKNKKWFNISLPGGLSLVKINNLKLLNDKLYLASESGFYLYDTKSKEPEFINLNPDNILNFYIEKTDPSKTNETKIWLVAQSWVGYYEKGETKILSDGIEIPDYKCKIQIDDEFIYIATKHQLTYINKENGAQNYLDQKEFYYRDGANSIFIDREKNVWTANNRGVHKIRKSLFKNFYQKDGLLSSEVSAIEFFEDGTMLLGHNKGLSIISNEKIKTIDFMSSLPIKENHSRILSVCRNENGNILFAAQTYGFGEIDINGNIKWYRFENEDYDYFAVHMDKKGDVWLSADHNLYKLVNGSLQKNNFYYEKDYIRVINSTKDGALLLGTSLHGIIIFEDGKQRIISSELASGNDVYSIYENENEILAGTFNGLYSIDNGKLIKFIKGDFRIDQPVFFIQPDSNNNLWFGLDNGLIKWDGKKYYKYWTNDGLAGAETNRAAGKADPYGNFWIGTNGGLSRYLSENSEPNVKPISQLLYIETEEGYKYDLDSDVKFDDNINTIVLHFKGISFIDETQNRNRIKLVNLKTNEEKIFYTNSNEFTLDDFPSGEYTIFLSTQNANGIWGDEIKSSKINNPHFSYSTVLLFSLIGVGFIIAFVSIVKIKKHFSKTKNGITSKYNQTSLGEESYKYENPKIVKLKSLLEDDKVYLNSDISLSKLALTLSTNKTDLSKLINSNYGQNFNSLINSYRIKEAKKMLTDPSYHNYTIEAISEMIGFKSKSAFHKAFKEFADVTPYQFKKRKINS